MVGVGRGGVVRTMMEMVAAWRRCDIFHSQGHKLLLGQMGEGGCNVIVGWGRGAVNHGGRGAVVR